MPIELETGAPRRRPLRVLFVLGHGGHGGIERHVECLLQNLDRGEVQPRVCVMMKAGAVSDGIAAAGVSVTAFDARHGHDWRIMPRFLRLLNEWKPDVIHAHELQAFAALALFLRPRYPLVYSLHVAQFEASPRRWWLRTAVRLLVRRVDRYLPVSEATWTAAKSWLKLPAERGTIFHNPVSLAAMPAPDRAGVRRELGLPCEAPLVGMVGRMEHRKGWSSFLEVCRRIGASRPEVHFLAVGDGRLRDELRRRPAATELGASLHWTGFRQDARRLIGGMDVLLLTSKHEEMPTTLLEAFAMFTPVVGFVPDGGTREVLALADAQPVSLLDAARDCARAARQTMDLLDDCEKRRRLAANARRLVETHFDARQNCGTLVDIYRQAVSQKCGDSMRKTRGLRPGELKRAPGNMPEQG